MKAVYTISIMCTILAAQTNLDSQKTLDKTSEKELMNNAEFFLNREDYEEALYYFNRLYDSGDQQRADINYYIGVCYLHTNVEKAKAITYLETAVKNVRLGEGEGLFKGTKAPYDSWLYLGNAYRINNEYDKAIAAYKVYMGLDEKKDDINNIFAKTEIAACLRSKDSAKKHVKISVTNLGDVINSASLTFNPAVSADETVMAFMVHMKFYDAVMVSRKVNGIWSDPVNITPEIQSDGDQYVCSLSADGKMLLLSKQSNFDSDIYSSTFNGSGWSVSKPLNKEINTKYWESHACISPDGKTLYFASNRTSPKNYGGMDIFYSELGKDGQWGTVYNIGPAINTSLNEETPFISEDGKTLYFSSQGHDSYGGYDIYTSTRQYNYHWSTPVNLGYPVNTSDDDLFFCPVKGNYGYQAKYLNNEQKELEVIKISISSPVFKDNIAQGE
jgi:tetratricopeptide (TPR) repeat protein